jgi:hypothetical protein
MLISMAADMTRSIVDHFMVAAKRIFTKIIALLELASNLNEIIADIYCIFDVFLERIEIIRK